MLDDTLASLPKFWQIWRNPIFIRYRRSRLRLSALITGALLYGGLSVFILLVSMGIATSQAQVPFDEVAIFTFIALIGLQIMILNFGGTGAVASGMAKESIDDVLTYQRLTPLSPLTKIVGYLAGLPVRQYYHACTTLPVTVIIIILGKISSDIWIPIYAVLITSTLMFHLLAMLVGFIMGKKFSALISQGLVALLYLAFPQLSNFGFVVFDYLTMRPALFVSLQKEFPDLEWMSESAMFFNWEISHIWYSIAVQILLSLVFLTVLLRRWRQETAHLLSKFQSVLLCIFAHVLILGGIWANTSNGDIFELNLDKRNTPTFEVNADQAEHPLPEIDQQELGRQAQIAVAEQAIQQNPQYIAGSIIGIYGLLSLTLAILLQYLYTPEKFTYLAGIRQRLKDGKGSIALRTDSASGIPATLAITAISIGTWLLYSRHLIGTERIEDYLDGRSWKALQWLIVLTLAAPLLGHGLALEKWGRKLVGTISLFAWIIPLAIAILGSAWSLNQDIFGLLYGLSPLAMVFSPAYGLTHLDYLMTRPFTVGTFIGSALYLGIAVTSLILLIQRHRAFVKQREELAQPND